MRHFGSILAILLAMSAVGQAQITKTATFENYAPGTILGSNFVDPLSGIAFSNPTPLHYNIFGIGSGIPEFDGGNYLSNGAGAGWAAYFGFTANLPSAANRISIEITYTGVPPGSSAIELQGFAGPNATGTLINSQMIPGAPDPYILSISSSQYDISSFQVSVGGVATGYDNISYTYLPEPGVMFPGIAALMFFPVRRRRRASVAGLQF